MIISFVTNSSLSEESLVHLHRLFMDSDAFNMIAMITRHNYGVINIDDPVAEVFYIMQFTKINIHYRVQ